MKARYQTSKKENGETSHEVVCECELMHWQLEFPSHGAAMNYIAALDDEMHQQLATEWVDTLFKVYPHEKGLSTKGAIERENVIESLGRIFEIVATRAKALQPNLSELQSGVDAKLRNAIMPVLFDHALGVFLARKELILDDDTAAVSFEINKRLADLLNMTDEEKAEYAMVLKGEAV